MISELRVPSDDPPDVELICAREIVPFEHTRLQPYPVGQFENLTREVSPSECVVLPPLSNPPRSRQEMLESMFSAIRPPFENAIDRWTVIKQNLEQTVRRKMRGLTGHGTIAVIDWVQNTTALCSEISLMT
jgi:hypothetical protein